MNLTGTWKRRIPAVKRLGSRILTAAVFIFVAAVGLSAQPAPAKSEFEVASVKLSVPGNPVMSMNGGPGTSDPERVTLRGFHLESLILTAYDIETYQITGPDWLIGNFGPTSVKVDIAAKLPPGTTKEQFHLMLQNLLAERFRLAIHKEQKEMPVYDLVVAKNGPKFRPSPKAEPAADNSPQPSNTPAAPPKITLDSAGFPILPTGTIMTTFGNRARMHQPHETMEQFAVFLSHQVHRHVSDSTGLKGEYDIGLFWGGSDGNPDQVTLEQAVQDQLGLKLNYSKGAADIYVVDHIEKSPVEN